MGIEWEQIPETDLARYSRVLFFAAQIRSQGDNIKVKTNAKRTYEQNNR